jgi:hypothetical protein
MESLDPDPKRRQNDADPQHRQWRQYPGDELRRRAGCHLKAIAVALALLLCVAGWWWWAGERAGVALPTSSPQSLERER